MCFHTLWKTHNPWKKALLQKGLEDPPIPSSHLPACQSTVCFSGPDRGMMRGSEDGKLQQKTECWKLPMMSGQINAWFIYECKWYGCDMVFFVCKCWRIFSCILMHKFRIRHYFTTSVSGINCHRLSPGFPPGWCHGAIRICFKHDFLLHCFVLGCPSLLVCSFLAKTSWPKNPDPSTMDFWCFLRTPAIQVQTPL